MCACIRIRTMKMATRCFNLTVAYFFTSVVLSVLIQGALQHSKETSSEHHNYQSVTNEILTEKERTNQKSLLGATDRLEKRFFFADKVSWSSWTQWSACSISCGKTGVQTLKRTCSRSGQFIVPNCPGSSSSTRSCVNNCPVKCVDRRENEFGKCDLLSTVNGHWSSWSVWSSCSISCGGTGRKVRHRSCNHPAPAYGGSACHGSSSQTLTCNHKCPVDGQWGSWSSFGACSVSCCTGSKVKKRSCDHPAPAYGGKNCAGTYKYTQACSNPCKGDAHWSSWGHWSGCSTTCDAGTMSRARTCLGQSVCTGPCSGHTTEKKSCNPRPCPINGAWGHWTSYSACSVTCCSGHVTKKRLCNHPAPSHGGKTCSGHATQAKTCTNSCKGDAAWSHWTHWSSCSASCLSGTMSRSRTCTNMTVCTGSCNGNGKDTTACDKGPCPEWSPWLFTPCSVTCGTGSKQGMRRCTSGHEEDCVGSSLTTEPCTESPCPVDGGWGNWDAWGTCSQTCGDGTRQRRRLCDNPVPAHMGKRCHGNTTDSSTCHVVDCPSWGGYYEVGTCSVTCGDGVIQLQRDCSTGNNHDCTGSPYDEKPCLSPAC